MYRPPYNADRWTVKAREWHGHFGPLYDGRKGNSEDPFCCTECETEAEDVFDLDDEGECEHCAEARVEGAQYEREVREQYYFGQTGR